MSAIFQASDLNQRGRAVLDAARNGEARVRDKDGLGLVVMPEARVRALRTVAASAANLATLEVALAVGRPPRLADYGDWTWLRHLSAEDVASFIVEVRDALIVAAREEQVDALDETLHAWQASAAALADSDSRAILLGGAADEDYVEVGPPGEEDAEPEGATGMPATSMPIAL